MLIWFRYVWIFSLHQLLSRHANSLHLEHRVHVSLHLTLSDAIVANGTDLRSCPKCRSFSENTRGFQKEGNKHHQHVNEIHQQKNKFRGNPLRTRKIHSPFFPQNGMLWVDFWNSTLFTISHGPLAPRKLRHCANLWDLRSL